MWLSGRRASGAGGVAVGGLLAGVVDGDNSTASGRVISWEGEDWFGDECIERVDALRAEIGGTRRRSGAVRMVAVKNMVKGKAPEIGTARDMGCGVKVPGRNLDLSSGAMAARHSSTSSTLPSQVPYVCLESPE